MYIKTGFVNITNVQQPFGYVCIVFIHKYTELNKFIHV